MLHLRFSDIFRELVTKLWEKLLLTYLGVCTIFPLLIMLRENEQNLRQAMLWFRNIVWGRGGAG